VGLSKILVVDDFELFRRFVCSFLQQKRVFQVAEASDGLEAVERAEQLNPDLILLDIGLPGLDGLEAAIRIHGSVPTARILFCSQESSPDVIREALKLGLGYIHKSHTHRDLFPAIEAVLSGRRFVSRNLEPRQAAEDPAPHHHEIVFCSDEKVLLDGLTRFIAAALKGGDAAIVWATELHRESILLSLRGLGVDTEAAIQRGTYRASDVAEPPDAELILAAIRSLKEAAAKAGKQHPRVAVCGERAGRLWAEGKTDVAIGLERFLNKLAKSHEMDILCVYPFPGSEEDGVKSVCREHSAVSFV